MAEWLSWGLAYLDVIPPVVLLGVLIAMPLVLIVVLEHPQVRARR